jgi:predicted amidohydrolase YtcJ
VSPSPATNDVIYTARVIRTANPSQPTADAIAIRDGRVLAVGTLEDCRSWGIDNVDTRFADKVLTAGFVEAHAHAIHHEPLLRLVAQAAGLVGNIVLAVLVCGQRFQFFAQLRQCHHG